MLRAKAAELATIKSVTSAGIVRNLIMFRLLLVYSVRTRREGVGFRANIDFMKMTEWGGTLWERLEAYFSVRK